MPLHSASNNNKSSLDNDALLLSDMKIDNHMLVMFSV